MVQSFCKEARPISLFFTYLFFIELFIVPFRSYGAGQAGYYFKVGNQASGFKKDIIPGLPGADKNMGKGYFPLERKSNPIEFQLLMEAAKKPFSGGPTQPEMQAFSSVNSNNMVDLFSGDFSYNVPLLDVGGYPLGLSYRGGVTMDQEASWVGLGWNINPGTINRNLRGLPDDFVGGSDSIRKVMNVKENKTIGVTAGADLEILGTPQLPGGGKDTISLGRFGASLGVVHNNYKGWGLEQGINASINSGARAMGPLTAGLSITNSSQEGLTVNPSLSIRFLIGHADDNASNTGNFSISAPYNTRSGLRALQLGVGVSQFKKDDDNQRHSHSSDFSTSINFASPTFTPTVTLPLTNRQYSFTAKVGLEQIVNHPSFYISGYVSKQRLNPVDTLLSLPAYGYLHLQEGSANRSGLMDFNREKEIPYRESPAVPNIAVPFYTYDAFSITGEGTGGMFRAYRGDIGFIHDHFIRTKDESDRLSIDVGVQNLVHAGADLNVNRAFTQYGPWLELNSLRKAIDFKSNSGSFEAVYFRNPGEKSVNSKTFYDAIGGDDVVNINLYQPGINSSAIQATSYLNRYHNKRLVGQTRLTSANALKPERDKRTQVISYLTASEASVAGLSTYIENYTPNLFDLAACKDLPAGNLDGSVNGLVAQYYLGRTLSKPVYTVRIDPLVNNDWGGGPPNNPTIPTVPLLGAFPGSEFSVRWQGRMLAPVTGTYLISTISDDGVNLWVNDSAVIQNFYPHNASQNNAILNLIAGQYYKIRLEYFQAGGSDVIKLLWKLPGSTQTAVIPASYLFLPAVDSFSNSYVVHEKRVNQFRKGNHISEINVLNNDGRRYVYGLPVYNTRQVDATFNVDGVNKGNVHTGLVGFTDGVDNSTHNQQGRDWYYNREEVPAFAHSFLLTGILSPDYVDLTGNGISDDDLGDAVKFNYSKISGIQNPYTWRAPYTDSASFNMGLKTDSRDDKGNYVYGEKELWYLHSIESKTMIATFTLENRLDLNPIDEAGRKSGANPAKRLKEINLYSKADFLKKGTSARPIKTVHFEYSYELCLGVNKPVNDSGKLTLKKVWFTYNGNDKGKKNPYIFHYNSLNPPYNIKSYDRWGNYRDSLQNPQYGGGRYLGNDDYPYASQDSTLAGANAAAWTLDSIYLPSGGAMKVDFESDDYAYVQNKRAAQMVKVLGMGNAPGMTSGYSNQLYANGGDNLYVYFQVPVAVSTALDAYNKYLNEIKKLYFRMAVLMPADKYGSGYEYVPCYVDIDPSGGYGRVSNNVIWVKISGISLKGDAAGTYSPLAKAAIQYIRLNLPSKAYPGSEIGDNIDLADAVKMMASLGDNIRAALSSFDARARSDSMGKYIDTARTWARLLSPTYKKMGGGHRVKRITIYDNWDKMTGQKAAIYGQEYSYTTTKEINGVQTLISSGVASYEPGIGGDENPLHQPIEYVERVAPLAPTTLGYTEEPLGESLYPSAGVGYSKVRVRTLNYAGKKSANGFAETRYYTAYDFPVYTDRTVLDNDSKKRYKPAIANFLKINAKHHVVVSQGFKVELNDMHGKLRSEATYAETDPNNPVTYTENIYKTDNSQSDSKRLSNTSMVIHPDGSIDTAALIGKDVELMADMREQLSVTNAYNVSINGDAFSIFPSPFFWLFPTFLNLAQREENLFRSAAITKVVQRYGVVDSVIHIDKGSKVSTKDLAYDSETGDVLLTRTQNEFNDPVYTFNYPSHWAYDGMGLAFKNIGMVLNGIRIKNGKIVQGLTVADTTLFASGDEILVAGKQKTGGTNSPCVDSISSFPLFNKIWAIDSSLLAGGRKAIFFIDKDGNPYNGSGISLKIIRSGRRNQLGSVGSVTSLVNPLQVDSTGVLRLNVGTGSKVVSASAGEFKQIWKVDDEKLPRQDTVCATQPYVDTTSCNCLQGLFNYLIASKRLFIPSYSGVTVQSLVNDAAAAGYAVSISDCPVLTNNASKPFFSLTTDSLSNLYRAKIGDCYVSMKPTVDTTVNFYQLYGSSCYSGGRVHYIYSPTQLSGCFHYYINILTIGNPSYSYSYTDCNGVAKSFTGTYYNPNPKVIDVIPIDSICAMAGSIVTTGCSSSLDMAHSCSGGIFNPSPPVQIRPNGSYDVILGVDSCYGCNLVSSNRCYDPLTDTLTNPYRFGILGNYRTSKTYTYFGRRAETDPTAATDIRKFGTFQTYSSFWNFSAGILKPAYDTSKWVWNSEITLLNKKGLEIENRDPLGRYNAGLYGYNQSLPIAVIQNARFRESAFEGFEDYGFVTRSCDTLCGLPRHFDFSVYKSKLDTVYRHSGKYSLKLAAGEQVGLSFNPSSFADDSLQAALGYTFLNDTCSGAGKELKWIKTDSKVLLPLFSPIKGQHMELSAWVREGVDCKCQGYTNNQIVIVFNGSGSTTLTFKPSGNIIEGWQRYDADFTVPVGATSMTLSLQSTGSTTVNFDDVRIHPYNSNMKSFVYNPINLRLMAELDENNYATYYEYDDDGTLIRVKKETQRGVMTIKETRSALLKQ